MYFQEVLFKPSRILASERDVRLMDAFFFLLVRSSKHYTCLPLVEIFHYNPSASSKTSTT